MGDSRTERGATGGAAADAGNAVRQAEPRGSGQVCRSGSSRKGVRVTAGGTLAWV